MFPLIIIFLLAQSLSATNEFPNLMQNIQVSWNGVNLTSKLDAGPTSSLDSQVRYFYLCGPYKTGKDGECRAEYRYETYGPSFSSVVKGDLSTYAHLIVAYDENNLTCMRYENPIPDFMVNKENPWYVHYNCKTVSHDYSLAALCVIGAIIVLFTIVFLAFKIGQKKGEESSKGISSRAYEASSEVYVAPSRVYVAPSGVYVAPSGAYEGFL